MYLVTGATGNVGSAVVAQLLAAGKKVRVFTRNTAKVAHWDGGVQVAAGDFQEPESFERAVAGAEAVFLMHQSPDQEAFSRLIAAAKAAGGPTIVFLSSLAADRPQLQIGQLHKRKEEAIRDSGLRGRFLRPGGFMSNTYQWVHTIKKEGVVYNPLGSTKFPAIAPEDIATFAVRALTDSSLTGEIFELTGGEPLTVPEQVDILAGVLGRSLRCVEIPVEAAVQNLILGGVPEQMAAAVGESYSAYRGGTVAVKDTVERVTGRPPMTFEAWVRKHSSRFA